MQLQLPSTADNLVKLDQEALLTPQEFRALVSRVKCSIKRVKISHRVLRYIFDILSALEQIGDKRDLPDVERLLKEHAVTNEVRVAAERCAQVIRERVAREAGKDILL